MFCIRWKYQTRLLNAPALLALASPPLYILLLYNIKSILKQVFLNFLINFGIWIEAWGMIYLNHPWFELSIEHNIKPEQFKTTIRFFLLTWPIDMLQLRLYCYTGLHNYSFYFIPNLLGWFRCTLLTLICWWLRHCALKTVTDHKFVFIFIEFLVLFVKTVIC